jgi:hypothetical protein
MSQLDRKTTHMPGRVFSVQSKQAFVDGCYTTAHISLPLSVIVGSLSGNTMDIVGKKLISFIIIIIPPLCHRAGGILEAAVYYSIGGSQMWGNSSRSLYTEFRFETCNVKKNDTSRRRIESLFLRKGRKYAVS